MSEVLVSENMVVCREYRDDDGQVRLELHLAGDDVDAAPDDDVSTGYVTCAAIVRLYKDGTVFETMNKLFGFKPRNIEIMEN